MRNRLLRLREGEGGRNEWFPRGGWGWGGSGELGLLVFLFGRVPQQLPPMEPFQVPSTSTHTEWHLIAMTSLEVHKLILPVRKLGLREAKGCSHSPCQVVELLCLTTMFVPLTLDTDSVLSLDVPETEQLR